MTSRNLIVWLLNLILGICIWWQWYGSQTASVVLSSHPSPSNSPSGQSPQEMGTPSTFSPVDAVSEDSMHVSAALLKLVEEQSPEFADQALFQPKTFEDMGLGPKSGLIAEALNRVLLHGTALETKFVVMGENALGEKILSLQPPPETIQEIEALSMDALTPYVPRDQARFLLHYLRKKLTGNLGMSVFTITRHDDEPSGEKQFVVRIVESTGNGSERFEPIDSTIIQQYYGHLTGKFRE